MSNLQALARDLLNQSSGGLGSVAIQPMQPGGYNPRGQVGSLPVAQVSSLGQQVVDYTGAAYTAGGLTVSGFGDTVVPANTRGFRVHIDVRRPFLPQSIWMPSTVVGLYLVDFQVEGVGLFANPGGQGIPCELVSEVSNMPQMQWITLNPDTGGEFVIDNPTLNPLVFSGGFWGTNIMRTR